MFRVQESSKLDALASFSAPLLLEGQILSKVWEMLRDRDRQINWVKKRNERVFRDGGRAHFYRTWRVTFLRHTERSGKESIKTLGVVQQSGVE